MTQPIHSDPNYQDAVITKVRDSGGGWEIDFQYAGEDWGASFYVPKGEHGLVPKVGDAARFYGKGLGSIVRGLTLNGEVVFYRTEAEEKQRHKEWVASEDARKQSEYQEHADEWEQRISALPFLFQQRIAGFRRRNPDFNWEYLAYEMSCCEDAVKIANAFPTLEQIDEFNDLSWEDQRIAIPELFDGHSGNSFSVAVGLARLFLSNPLSIPLVHGALCPLVGCESYGCYATEVHHG